MNHLTNEVQVGCHCVKDPGNGNESLYKSAPGRLSYASKVHLMVMNSIQFNSIIFRGHSKSTSVKQRYNHGMALG